MAELLPIGSQAPDFSLAGTTGETIHMRDYRGKKHLVLAFYPKDHTSG